MFKLIYELISLEEGEVINDVVLEVTAGVGGQEAMLFAQKLNMLYTNYTNFNNWTYDVVNFEQSDIGTFNIKIFLNDCLLFQFIY